MREEIAADPQPVPQGRPAKQDVPQTQASRRGGYYQDDGPGDQPPPNLDVIADAEPRLEPLHRYANNPYNVFGLSYVPLRTRSEFRQRGVGSWYGRKFHGQRTSSGEIYDMYSMTAAHPTLPIPSYARVTHVASGRSVVVRINDRGPFHSGRIIDLSYAAAWKLGYAASGSAVVDVEAVTPVDIAERAGERAARGVPSAARRAQSLLQSAPDDPKPLLPAPSITDTEPGNTPRLEQPAGRAAAPDNIYLQLAAFSVRESAERLSARLTRELAWLDSAIEIFSKDGMFRLHIGPFRDRRDATRVAARIQEAMSAKPLIVIR